MTRYRILQPAREELRSAARWYEQHRDRLGHALIDEFEERLALALEHPHAGTVVGPTTQGLPIRRHRLTRFARYSILMFVDEDGTATVLAFSHSARNPVHRKIEFANQPCAALECGRSLVKREPGRSRAL